MTPLGIHERAHKASVTCQRMRGTLTRNKHIRQRVQHGERIADIAREYGVTRQRIDQIVNRLESLARNRLHAAVCCGKVRKSPHCQFCGQRGNVEAHHADYEKWDDVVWLCRRCHNNADRARTNARRRADATTESGDLIMSTPCTHPGGPTLQVLNVDETGARCVCRLCGTPMHLDRYGVVTERDGGPRERLHGPADPDGMVAPPHSGMKL